VSNGTYSQAKVDGWIECLKTVYNRGFWDGYYLGKKMGEWTGQPGSVATTYKEYTGKVTNYFRKLKVAEIRMESGSLSKGDRIYIQGPTTGVVEISVPEIRVDLKEVKKTVKGESCSIPIDIFLRRADKVYKILTNN
jgi:putative protease